MCFSATASFVAAGALGAVGTASLSRAHHPRETAFAAIPLGFAAQQVTEGLVWLGLHDATRWYLNSAVVLAYLVFALAAWPAYVPFAVASLERPGPRRRVLQASCAAGVVLGAYLLAHALRVHTYACVIADHLYYAVRLRSPLRTGLNVVYLASTAGSMVVSSRSDVRALGVGYALAYALTIVIARTELVSVWCFFAACLSVGVLGIVGRPERA